MAERTQKQRQAPNRTEETVEEAPAKTESGDKLKDRGMEKVVQADRFSGVAIAGSAGPAMEMIKLFQLQLEHYEKVEGASLSLEGKANQLSMMVRGNLPAAMQGLVVVPIFAGYDTRRRQGRLFTYDATGGRDEVRGIYPVVATVTEEGFARVDDDELRRRYEAIAAEVSAR